MKKIKFVYFLIVFVLSSMHLFGQSSNMRNKTMVVSNKPEKLDSLSVIPTSIKIWHQKQLIDSALYTFLWRDNTLVFDSAMYNKEVEIHFNVFSWNWNESIYLLDTSIIQKSQKAPYQFRAQKTGVRFGSSSSSGLQKQGSISRSVVVGNGQNTTVNSDLNLQITGELSPGLYIRANVSDRTIPVQPEGNTQNLQEFDQVYVETWNDHFKLTGGDFETASGDSYFGKYQKRARGLLYESAAKPKGFVTKVGAAISRGKFGRNIINGVEGNQGPYRLTGSDNETFITVIAGTERVFVNGRPMKRGLSNDYVIDYNNAEITFTANELVTKDSRIIVEFQYADQQFARALVIAEQAWSNEQWNFYSKYYREQDAKNQPLQIDVTDELRTQLNELGDPLYNQPLLIEGARATEFNEESILYEKIDTLGFEGVYEYSENANKQLFVVGFTKVAQGQGDYVLTNPVANGKVYRWVAPDTINGELLRNGNYIPKRPLSPPEKRMLWINGIGFKNEKWEFSGELANSTLDRNTFSEKDSQDNNGLAYLVNMSRKVPTKSGQWAVGLGRESQSKDFKGVERFRNVEFERDWNLTGILSDTVALIQNNGFVQWKRDSVGFVEARYDQLLIDTTVNGKKASVNWRLQGKKNSSVLTSSFLNNSSDGSTFIRHKGKHEKSLQQFTFGYEDEREENTQLISDSLSTRGYQFYWYRGHGAYQIDESKNISVFAGQRIDRLSTGSRLASAAIANEAGISTKLSNIKNQQLQATVQFRELKIQDTTLLKVAPESTTLWQLNYQGKLAKGFIRQQLFLEFGSGLERKRTFQYVKVPLGQGVYAYTDFNNNGQQELDEFYVSPFSYEADYIKVYLPTNDYVKAYTANTNYQIQLNPSVFWKEKSGIKKWVGKINTLHNFKYFAKTNEKIKLEELFENTSSDVILTKDNSQRHRINFNQFNPNFGVNYTYVKTNQVQLLVDGFQERFNERNSVVIRKVWLKKIQLFNELANATEGVGSDFLTQQNFQFKVRSIKPEANLQWTENTNIILDYRYVVKSNESKLYIGEGNFAVQHNTKKNGNVLAKLGVVNTSKLNIENANLRLAMYEGFVAGLNYTWSVISQQQLSENLQLTLNYQGRASKDNPTVHVGTVQVRAFF